jgi:PBP1b-binding outer membrane lipoprotein LpoB
MKSRLTVKLALLAMLVSGCSSIPTKDIQVEAQTDPKAKMSGYKTYTWLMSAAILNDSYGQWEPPAFDADTEIKHLIDRELRKRGLSEKSVNPDMIVAFAAGIDMDALEVKVDPNGDLRALNVPQGGLAVMLLDNQTGYIIWMGVAAGDVQDRPDTQTAKARLDYAVTKLLKQLPK